MHRAFSQGPQGSKPSLCGCGLVPHRQPAAPGWASSPPSAQHCMHADAVVFKVLRTGDASLAQFGVISHRAQAGPNRTTVSTGQCGHEGNGLAASLFEALCWGVGHRHPAKGNGLATEAESQASLCHTDFCPNQAAW